MRAATIVWISGATQGLGLGLARTCPYPDARIINLSRRAHPDLETVKFDLTDPATWVTVGEHFREELSRFSGERALFIHNAFHGGPIGFIGEVDRVGLMAEAMGNCVAPLVLADSFVRSVRPEFESGLVLMSSASARVPFEGQAVYGAAKAGVEQFVRVLHRERSSRGQGPWVVAVRPGFVDTPAVHAAATAPAQDFPVGQSIEAGLSEGEADSPEDAARRIWDALPPPPEEPLLMFGSVPRASRP